MNPNESTAILPRHRLPASAINSDFMNKEVPCTASTLHKALDDEWRARMSVLRAPNSKTAADAYMEAQRNTSRIEEAFL